MADSVLLELGLEDELNTVFNASANPIGGDDDNGDLKLPGDYHEEEFFNNDNWLDEDVSSCKRILYSTLGAKNPTRVWDVLILVPNLCFLVFLVVRLRRVKRHLSSTNSPMMASFHNLVFVTTLVGVVRCIFSIVDCNSHNFNEAFDKTLWLTLRFFLLATEISVIAFALRADHLESKASVRRVVLVAFAVSLAATALQATIEFASPDPAFQIYSDTDFSLFGHGGRVFLAIYSTLFAAMYGTVLILPMLPCRRALVLPQRRSFYYYSGFLLALNVVQAVGSGMTESQSGAVFNPGLCFVNMTTYIHFVAFTPIVYFAFLAQFFGSHFTQPELLFSYKAQLDEMDDDAVQSPVGITLGSSAPEDDPAAEDLFAQEQNNPIIISGTLGLSPSRASLENRSLTNSNAGEY